MKKLTAILKTMMKGLEYAEGGEYLTPRQKGAYLDKAFGINPAIAIASHTSKTEATDNRRRRLALYLGSQLPKEVMDYVLQTCSNLKHDLTVITFETEGTVERLLAPYEKTLADAKIDVKIAALNGDPISRLTRYLRSHPEIAFLACKETGYLAHNYMKGGQNKTPLPVPVVVVVTKKHAAEEKLLTEQQQISKNNAKIA